MQCYSCHILLNDEMQYYTLSEIGSEICSIISRNLNHEIDYVNNLLCEDCFTAAANQLASESRFVSEGQCVWCLKSIFNCHSHSLPNGPERDDIACRILPRQIQPVNRVCYACWLAARRNVQRAQQQDQPARAQPSTSQLQPSTSQRQEKSYDPKCIWCQASLARRHSHSLPEGPERDHIAQRISPRMITTRSRVCYACWLSARRNIQVKVKEDPDAPTNYENNDVSLTTLHNFRRTGNSERSCFVHGCVNVERHVVPNFLRYRILKSNKLYVTENARICSQHLGVYDWEFLNDYGYIRQFTPSQLEAMLTLALTNVEINKFDFEQIT